MISKKIIGLLTFTALLIIIASCSKEPGVGGSSSISGTIRNIVSYAPAGPTAGDTTFHDYADKDVFLIYGDDQSIAYHDKYASSWNGTFRFDNLRKGTYNVFVLEKCDACEGDLTEIFHTVTIDKNGEDYNIGYITLDDDEKMP